MTEVKIPKGTL